MPGAAAFASLDDLRTMIRDPVSCHFGPSKKPGLIRIRRAMLDFA
jgi:hypothetical protein